MEIIATENRIEALQLVNRMTAIALQELNEREYFYNQHADLLAQLSVFAARNESQVGVCPIINNKHPVVYLMIATEEMAAFRRKVQQFFAGIAGFAGSLEGSGNVLEFYGLQHIGEKQLRLTICIRDQ